MSKFKISRDLLDYVVDGDLHTKMDGVKYSTNLREIVTVGYMLEEYKKAPTAGTVDATA